jgi:hypothetical protein
MPRRENWFLVRTFYLVTTYRSVTAKSPLPIAFPQWGKEDDTKSSLRIMAVAVFRYNGHRRAAEQK